MQLKFKLEMLLSETRAFPGELKVVIISNLEQKQNSA